MTVGEGRQQLAGGEGAAVPRVVAVRVAVRVPATGADLVPSVVPDRVSVGDVSVRRVPVSGVSVRWGRLAVGVTPWAVAPAAGSSQAARQSTAIQRRGRGTARIVTAVPGGVKLAAPPCVPFG